MKSKGTRYTTKEMARAKSLVEAGWNPTETSRFLRQEFGRSPNPTTIRKWADPDYYEAVKMRERIGGISGPNRYKTWKLRLERMQALRGLGLSYADVAAVVSHDFSIAVTAWQADRILSGTLTQPSVEELLWPQGRQERRRTGRPLKIASAA